ncbi:hypothetical protein AC629_36390 [Bradyrhizobium sp. NAS80.1]|uniref:hypothetical protein n=1 Tax=Bradyrhizobium sp. NAS80.1 TaxID=1680159 RepID=UPI00095CE390|nr:hypothetical protein [Bradyrhizobium sp. NAS80.1]OKO73745.1 hypothetical protein AC629_36390 [Bradyrhizobium sp. NAS80.1]
MSKFTPEEAAEIIAQSHETLRRVNAALAGPRLDLENAEAVEIAASFEPRVETRNQRDRRELEQQEALFAVERERDRMERAEIAAVAAAEQRIAGLEAEVLELARATNTVIEALEGELAHVTSENRELKLAQVKLETRVAELRIKVTETVDPDRKDILELPLMSRLVQ